LAGRWYYAYRALLDAVFMFDEHDTLVATTNRLKVTSALFRGHHRRICQSFLDDGVMTTRTVCTRPELEGATLAVITCGPM
jgi:hypothetical protein